MPTKKGQRLTLQMVNERKDWSGIIDVGVLINGKAYTYPISSAYALEKVKRLLKCKHPKPGKALNVLKTFSVEELYDRQRLKEYL